jgi:MFS family permease
LTTTPVASDATSERSPIAEILAIRDFRFFWGAQFLNALIAGISRFAFVWFALEISDWTPAVAVMGLAVGIPGMVVTLPAGAIADRVDRRILVMAMSLAGSAIFGVAALLVFADLMNLAVGMIIAAGIGTTVAVTMPTFQAMVPQIVPRTRLINGIAIQNMGQSVSLILGAVVGGGTIAAFGFGPAFLAWGVLMLGSAILMIPVMLRPYEVEEGARGSVIPAVIRSIRSGLAYGFGREPTRSLLIVGLFMGTGIGTYGILLPEIAKNELGQNAFGTSLLFAMTSVGMTVSSLYLASRREIGRKGILHLAAFLCFGPGLFVMGISSVYVATGGFMILWGAAGGVLMTSQRALLQEHTDAAMMGRVMSIVALSFNGMLPVAALYVLLMRSIFDAGAALAIMGAATAVGAVLITSRSPLRHV